MTILKSLANFSKYMNDDVAPLNKYTLFKGLGSHDVFSSLVMYLNLKEQFTKVEKYQRAAIH